MKTHTGIRAGSGQILSRHFVTCLLCSGYIGLFAPFAGASDQIDTEKDTGSITETFAEDSDTEGLVWILEADTTQLKMPSDDAGESSGETSKHTQRSIGLAAQWYGSLSNISRGYLDLSLYNERIHVPTLRPDSDTIIELNEIWIESDLSGFDSALRIGLQVFEDDHGWWWNDERVGAQLLGQTESGWGYSVAAIAATNDYNSRNEPADPELQSIYYLLLQAQTNFSDGGTFSAFGLHRVDRSGAPATGTLIRSGFEDESDATLTHLGLGVIQEINIGKMGQLNLRGDVALLNGNDRQLVYAEDEDGDDEVEGEGEEATDEQENSLNDNETETLLVTGQTQSSISAWAIDLGLDWQLPFSPEPVLEFGFAVGSGTSMTATEGSKTFSQTDLHDNSQGRGTYGSVLAPELSNLQVLSAAVSISLGDIGDISFYHHRFRKMRASGELPDNELDLQTEGETNSANIGNETGLYLLLEAPEDFEVKIAISQFRHGDAFPSLKADTVDRVSIELSYEF